jgi:hypothetical protein
VAAESRVAAAATKRIRFATPTALDEGEEQGRGSPSSQWDASGDENDAPGSFRSPALTLFGRKPQQSLPPSLPPPPCATVAPSGGAVAAPGTPGGPVAATAASPPCHRQRRKERRTCTRRLWQGLQRPKRLRRGAAAAQEQPLRRRDRGAARAHCRRGAAWTRRHAQGPPPRAPGRRGARATGKPPAAAATAATAAAARAVRAVR